MKVKRIAFVVHVSECFWRPSEFLRTCWDIIRREELGFPHIASPHYTHLALMCHELPGKPYTHTPVHTHTTACMPQLSFFLFISFPFQNRQRNGHSISNGRLTKDISWSANLTKCLYLEISYGPNRKSGGDTVTQLQIIDLWRQISWIIQKKKKKHSESWVIQFVSFIDPINWTNAKSPFCYAVRVCFVGMYCESTSWFLGEKHAVILSAVFLLLTCYDNNFCLYSQHLEIQDNVKHSKLMT